MNANDRNKDNVGEEKWLFCFFSWIVPCRPAVTIFNRAESSTDVGVAGMEPRFVTQASFRFVRRQFPVSGAPFS